MNPAPPTERLERETRFLYGDVLGPSVARQMRERLTRMPPLPEAATRPRAPLPLTQRDALLIAYGDQVSAPGEAPLQTLGKFSRRHLAGLVSGVHLLPHYPYSSDDGFAVIDYHQVDPALGTWADVQTLGRSFELMLDGVFNHLSARSNWFRRFLAGDPAFAEFFVTVTGTPDLSAVVRPRALPLLTEFAGAHGPVRVWTTFSADQVDLNFGQPAVLLAILDALLFYVAQGLRFLRLDAIAYLWKEIGTPCIHRPQTHAVIRCLRAALDLVAPSVLFITETNVPHRDNLSYFGHGTDEAQLVYNFALPPLVLHALLRGTARPLTAWAQSLALPSDQVAFLNFLASHDGIGLNPARGLLPDAELEFLVDRCQAHGGFISYKHNPDGSRSPYEMNTTWFDALSDPQAADPPGRPLARLLLSHAVMLALQGMPAVYFHSLFGSRNDLAAAQQSGIPRRVNRQKFAHAELEAELAQPYSPRAQAFAGMQRLLRARARHPAFHPRAAQDVLELDHRVFALRRTAPDGQSHALCLHNLSSAPVDLPWPPAPADVSLTHDLLAGPHRPTRGPLRLEPCTALWLASTAPAADADA